MYEWLVFLHVLAVLLFLLAHGVQVAVMLRQRTEADPEVALTLFNVLPALTAVRVLLAAIVATGLILGFLRPWWQQAWMWVSLAVLVAILVVMRIWGMGYYDAIAQAATAAVEERAVDDGPTTARLAFDAARARPDPFIVTVVGVGGLASILWLMMFKPF